MSRASHGLRKAERPLVGPCDREVARSHRGIQSIEAPAAEVGLESRGVALHVDHSAAGSDGEGLADVQLGQVVVEKIAGEHPDTVAAHLCGRPVFALTSPISSLHSLVLMC